MVVLPRSMEGFKIDSNVLDFPSVKFDVVLITARLNNAGLSANILLENAWFRRRRNLINDDESCSLINPLLSGGTFSHKLAPLPTDFK